MKISIIVPIYNVEAYLKRCLDSIINESYRNLEIILVDDGSTDNSGKICDAYANLDARIIVIHEENKGLSGARNAGLKRRTGDFVWFIDGDDYIEKNSCEVILPYLKNYDIVVFNYNNVHGNKVSKVKSFYDYSPLTTKYVLSHCNAWNKIIKSSLLENDPFPLNHIYEDLFFIPTLILKTRKIKFLDNYLYNYVYRNNSIKNSDLFFDDMVLALNNLYFKLNEFKSSEVEYLYIYNLLITSLIEEVKRKKHYDFHKLNDIIKEKYPNYYNNKYFCSLGVLKRLYLYLIYHNYLFIPRIMTYLKIKVFDEKS